MIKFLTPVAIVLLLNSGLANAGIIKNSNQAVTACKTHLKASVPGFKRAKLGQIRNSREFHTITFAVTSDTGREKTKCIVNKQDGAVALKN